jgi:hypothetical protein
MGINTTQWESIQLNGNQYNSMGINTTQCQSVQLNVSQYNSMSVSTTQCQSVQLNVSQYNSMSVSTTQWEYMFIYANHVSKTQSIPKNYNFYVTKCKLCEKTQLDASQSKPQK